MAHKTFLDHVSSIASLSGNSSWIKPELFGGRHERRLAAAVGITQFGVNLVTLEPGSYSALRHWHEAEDEFV